MAFNTFAGATASIPLANLDANFTAIGTSDAASTLFPTATTSITYGAGASAHIFNTSNSVRIGTISAPVYTSVLRVQGGIENYSSQFNAIPGASTNFDLVNRSTNGGLRFFTNADETTPKVVIDSSGNVGIGISSPVAKLQINGVTGTAVDLGISRSSSSTTIQSAPNITFSDGTTNNTICIQNSQGALTFWNYGTGAWTERMRIDSSGNVLCGGVANGISGSVNGNLFSYPHMIQNDESKTYLGAVFNANAGSQIYSLIAVLPASTAGTLDNLHLKAVVNDGWGGVSTGVLEITMGNREGFAANYTTLGNHCTTAGIVAYQQTSGETYVYAVLNGTYNYIKVDVLNASTSGGMAVYFENWTATVPTGTIVFDSRNPTTYRPAYVAQNGNMLLGYTATNGDYRLQVNSQIFALSSTIATPSDAKYKENISSLENALDLVCALNPVSFDWKAHPVHAFNRSTKTTGFIAQEVQQALSNTDYVDSIVQANSFVLEPEEKDNDGNITKPAVTEEFLGIAEGNLIALLTSAIQELKTELDSVKSQLSTLQGN